MPCVSTPLSLAHEHNVGPSAAFVGDSWQSSVTKARGKVRSSIRNNADSQQPVRLCGCLGFYSFLDRYIPRHQLLFEPCHRRLPAPDNIQVDGQEDEGHKL